MESNFSGKVPMKLLWWRVSALKGRERLQVDGSVRTGIFKMLRHCRSQAK